MTEARSSGPSSAPDDEAVPGLAGERTDLAWNRSALALGVTSAAVVRRVWLGLDSVTGRVVVYGILAAAAFTWLGARVAAAVTARSLAGRPVAAPVVLRRVTYGTLTLALVALVLAIVPYEE